MVGEDQDQAGIERSARGLGKAGMGGQKLGIEAVGIGDVGFGDEAHGEPSQSAFAAASMRLPPAFRQRAAITPSGRIR